MQWGAQPTTARVSSGVQRRAEICRVENKPVRNEDSNRAGDVRKKAFGEVKFSCGDGESKMRPGVCDRKEEAQSTRRVRCSPAAGMAECCTRAAGRCAEEGT